MSEVVCLFWVVHKVIKKRAERMALADLKNNAGEHSEHYVETGLHYFYNNVKIPAL